MGLFKYVHVASTTVNIQYTHECIRIIMRRIFHEFKYNPQKKKKKKLRKSVRN